MESLTFPLLSLQFCKHQTELNQNGITVELGRAANLFQDTLVISRKAADGRTYQFHAQFRKWDRYREFTITMGSSLIGAQNMIQYHFRLNPVSGEPMRVHYNSGGSTFPNIWSNNSEFPSELQSFGEDILKMINQINERIQIDKVALDSTELN